MTARLGAILAIVALALVVLLVAAPRPARAITCSAGLVTFYVGPSGSGGAISYCGDDYPSTMTWASFEHGQKFSSGLPVDNNISSLRWGSTLPVGSRVRIWQGYNFNGSWTELTKSSAGETLENMFPAFDNAVSSFLSCGTTCVDDPQ
jgi:hypothetical protein